MKMRSRVTARNKTRKATQTELGNGLLTTCRAPFSEALQRTQKHVNPDCFPRNTLASLSLEVKWSSILCEISAGSSPSQRESYSQLSLLVKPLTLHFTCDTKYLYNRYFGKSYQTQCKPILTKILMSEIRSLSRSLELRYRKSTCSPCSASHEAAFTDCSFPFCHSQCGRAP